MTFVKGLYKAKKWQGMNMCTITELYPIQKMYGALKTSLSFYLLRSLPSALELLDCLPLIHRLNLEFVFFLIRCIIKEICFHCFKMSLFRSVI